MNTILKTTLLQGTGIVLLLALTLGCLMFGCSNKTVEQMNPAPSSSLTLQQATDLAKLDTMVISGGSYSPVSATGSMLPLFDSHSMLVWEPTPPLASLLVGDIVSADEGALGQPKYFCHKIEKIDLSNQAVWISGANNIWPDGWIPYAKLHGRLMAIIYSKG